MKKLTSIIFFSFWLTCRPTYSQINLVPNASFEDTLSTPFGADIFNCVGWTAPTQLGTTDFFNAGSPVQYNYSVPQNVWGYQNAFHGNGYAMVLTYNFGGGYREYLQVKLNSTLVNNVNYIVSFYASLADSVANAANNLGFSFSPTLLNVNTAGTLAIAPYYSNNTIMTNQNGWTKVSSVITANGSENYLIIGNFIGDNSTSTSTISGNPIWDTVYFIDSVSVAQTDQVGITELNLSNAKIYPNPSTDILNIELTKIYSDLKAVIYDYTGQIVRQIDLSGKLNKISLTELSSGLYNITLILDRRTISHKTIRVE